MAGPSGIRIRGLLADGSTDRSSTIEYVWGDLDHGNKPYLDDQGQPLTVVTLRQLSADDLRRLRKRHTIATWKNHQRVEELDEDAYTADLIDYLIVEWRGILSEDDQPVPCTREAKLAVANRAPGRLAHMIEVATSAEVVDREASFREPAGLPRMAR